MASAVTQLSVRSDATLPTGGVRFSTLVSALEDMGGDIEFEVVGLRDAMVISQQVGCELAGGFWKPGDVVAQLLISSLSSPPHDLCETAIALSGTQAHDG